MNDYKKAKSLSLAPIATKILLSWGSGQEIEVKSGTMFPEMPNLSAPQINNQTQVSE